MTFIEIVVRRFSVVSSRPFDEIVQRVSASIGRPSINAFRDALTAARDPDELASVVRAAIGPSELMEFARFDAGEVLRKGTHATEPRILRLLVGNPLIMKAMAETVPDAAAYAPVTLLVDQRADGVHLSYDCLASLLAPYSSKRALAVAAELDAKVLALLEAAAR